MLLTSLSLSMPVAVSWPGMCFLLCAGKRTLSASAKSRRVAELFRNRSGERQKTLVLLSFLSFFDDRNEYLKASKNLAFMSIIRTILKKDMFSGKKYI